jgi:hypothetical protein
LIITIDISSILFRQRFSPPAPAAAAAAPPLPLLFRFLAFDISAFFLFLFFFFRYYLPRCAIDAIAAIIIALLLTYCHYAIDYC